MAGDGDAKPPLLAVLSDLWWKSPCNPEEFLGWDAELTFKMWAYQQLKAEFVAAKRGD